MSHYDKAREAYANQSDVRARINPTPPEEQRSLTRQLLEIRDKLSSCVAVSSNVNQLLTGPTPSPGTASQEPNGIGPLVDEIEALANAIEREVRVTQARL